MGIRILIPCKTPSAGKTRLSSFFTVDERTALCCSLLAQTVALATGIAPTTVVTSDVAAADISRRHNIFSEPPRADLNTALSAAYSTFSPNDAVLVRPIDQPLLTPATILQVRADEDLMTIVPDQIQGGTNLMFLS